MTTIEFYPDDVYNQRTIRQGHPPDWVNREGGDYDLVVLGGGPGGLTAATTAAAGGHRVAMTEQRLTGGTCVNFGCTPSKAQLTDLRLIIGQHRIGRVRELLREGCIANGIDAGVAGAQAGLCRCVSPSAWS